MNIWWLHTRTPVPTSHLQINIAYSQFPTPMNFPYMADLTLGLKMALIQMYDSEV